jgi:tRNA pseudouridine65 synthase
MQQTLASESTIKRYLALARGIVPERGVIEHALAKTRGGDKRPATTEFERLGTFERYSLLEARPHTGRLHQIRRHMKHLSHPLIGDVRYGKAEHNRRFRERFALHRLALHARAIQFRHPVTHASLDIRAPLPPDLEAPLTAMGFAKVLEQLAR